MSTALLLEKSASGLTELESRLSSFIWSLIGPDQYVGQMITAEMSFSRKLDLLSSLFQYRCMDTQQHNLIKKLVTRLSNVEQERNTVQHSLWIRQSNNPSEALRLKITAKRKHGLKHAKEVITSQPLELFEKELQETVSALASFMTTFLANEDTSWDHQS